MKQMRTKIMLAVVATVIGIGLAGSADAQVRVEATLRTPQLEVRFDNYHDVNYGPIHRCSNACSVCRVSELDRQIARRLGRFADVPPARLIQMRRRGYEWNQIGHFIGVSRPVVRAAMHQSSWNHFLKHNRGDFCQIQPRKSSKHGKFRNRGVSRTMYQRVVLVD